jgi:anthranilate synthase
MPSLAPTPTSPELIRYVTRGGVAIERSAATVSGRDAVEQLIDQLDHQRGVLLSSGYDFPGRYTRWDMGFCNPPLCVTAKGRQLVIEALNERGTVLLAPIVSAVSGQPWLRDLKSGATRLDLVVKETERSFTEEERSRQPTAFSVLRTLVDCFAHDADAHLGLYGAFGYDLTFQFEPIALKSPRPADQRDLVLYLPDELLIVDHQKEQARSYRYDFEFGNKATRELPRVGHRESYVPASKAQRSCDHDPGEYAAAVRKAKESFKRGDLFEVVLSQTFIEPCSSPPSTLFRRLRKRNPAPYALFLNLGEQEYLVGASPEMYVRVDKRRVETCPISGTISRGRDAVEDAERIRELLDSRKDESELTMCTDVDRNDKSRICVPGSVRVIGRRQIELYSRLIHTVDHVEGTLLEQFDALDAFLSHTWAVTVTGAPKPAAIQHVENAERSPRAWYGGAIGVVNFNGNLNTGLTLRTVRLKDGLAQVRAGATLLYDSVPEAEEQETRVKASAFLDAVTGENQEALAFVQTASAQTGKGRRVLFVDHQDSFVHTLANYIRQTGAEVTTLRSGFDPKLLDQIQPDLVFLSPGPGTPSDFKLSATIQAALDRKIAIFGVCLGLQGLVEYFGGELGVLDYPMHGKPSTINVLGGRCFSGLPQQFTAGRYHSLYAKRDTFPAVLQVTAETEGDRVIMGIEHSSLPIAAVQFHPESILTLAGDNGLRLLSNAISVLTRP